MSRLSEKVRDALDELLDSIDRSEENEEFKRLKYIIDNNDEAYDLIRRAQELRTTLYNMPEHESGSEYAEKLVEEYDNLCENTIVYEYLRAEVAMGDMVRYILESIVERTELRRLS